MQKITDIFIKRPVLATVISLFIFIFGLRAIFMMQLREYPKMDNTVITISTVYPGASANLVQSFITTPIEKAIASANGVNYFTSNSDNSLSTVTAYIKLNYDPNKAFTDIMSKVEQVKNQLPQAAQNPVILKQTGSQISLMYISYSSKTMSNEQITAYLDQVVQPKLETLPGVASVNILGKKDYAMRIWLDPQRMAAFGVTSGEVAMALQQNNFQAAAGTIKGKYNVLTVNANTDITSVNGFKNIIIKHSDNGRFVYLKDVARVQLGAENYDSSVYFNNKKAVFVSIDPTPTANPLTVIDGVNKLLPQLKSLYPPGLQSSVVYDATKFIKASIHEVIKTIIEAGLIVILVIYFFLGSFRTISIPIVTMPLSLVGVFGLMLLLGYSINLLTLLAIVLAIGLVVDDAIVVVENTHRHIQQGAKPLEAAILGAREIAMPVIAMSITLAAVYIPIGFMQGVTGALFTEFAYTLAAAVILSGVIALTLSPMMCSKLLLSHEKLNSQGGLSHRIDEVFNRLKFAYQKSLTHVVKSTRLVSVFAALILVSCGFLYLSAPKQLAPTEDEGVVMSIGSGPKYANLDYMNKYAALLNQDYASIPSKQSQFSVIGMGGVNNLFSMLMLKPWSERKQSQQAVYQQLNEQVKNNPGLQIMIIQPPPLPTSKGGPPIQFVLTSLGSYQNLYRAAQQFVNAALASGRFYFLSSTLNYDKPTVDVKIDRAKAALYGVNMQSLAQDLSSALSGGYVNRFAMYNHSYQVIPQLADRFRLHASQIKDLYIKNTQGNMIPLANLVDIHYSVEPNSLTRFNQLNSATIQGMYLPGLGSIDSSLDYLRHLAKRILPVGVSFDYAGASREYMQEGNALIYAFVFSLIIIFLVLSAQFESFSSPLIVMISVPMAICGALLPLNWGGRFPLATVNIYSQIGLITLIGLITKHGILMVEFADKLRQKSNITRYEAIIQAATTRLRPVLMTTAAMIFGVIPLLLASGAGAVSRFDIGLMIASGMFVGTLFTLFVVPTVYTLKTSGILKILLSAVLLFMALYLLIYVIL